VSRVRLLVAPAMVSVALGLAVGVSVRWSPAALDALTPDAPRVDNRILVIGFGGRDTFDGNHVLIWPAHRRGIYLRDVATAAFNGGALAVVLVGYDGLSLLDGAAGRDALASATAMKQVGIIPLEEVALYAPGGELPLATHYRVDDLSTSAAGVGLPVDHNRSGRTRTVPLLARTLDLAVGTPPVNVPPAGRDELAADAKTVVPSLALRALLAVPDIGVLGSPSPSSLTLAGHAVPLEGGALRVRWSSELDDASDPSVVQAIEVLGEGLSPQSYRGKIVLVGTTDPTQTDFIDTPIGQMPELLVQANVLNTLLTGSYERPIGVWFSSLVALVTVLSVMIVWRRRQPLAVVVAVVVAGGWLAATWLMADHGRLLNPLMVPVATVVAVALLGVRRLAGVARERRKLRALFSQYVPATVARQLVDSGTAQSAAAGARLTVTTLFCDLRGFTATAARLTPAQVRELLDCYYEALSPLILEHDGTVMQYTGDEIFAVFGAPTPMPGSAETALTVAEAMFDHQQELNDQLAARRLPTVNYGIGLHTGEVVAAHVGSQIRRQYSVIGDTVNVGNRYCSLARAGQVAYSEELRAACAEPPHGEPISGVQLKGVDHPVTAYIIQLGSTDQCGGPQPPALPEPETRSGAHDALV
jgi:class 3 adenylate cyclase